MAQIVFQTDQSGANTNICSTVVASTVTFNFSVSSNYDAYSANIVMKKASSTVDPVTVTIYNQPNGGGSAVGSSTVLASAVTQSFATITFLFSSLTLVAGTSYSLVLSSTTGCSGSLPYSFKAGNFQVLDKTTLTVINTGYGIASALTSVATLSPTTKASKVASTSITSSASLTSSAYKSRALNLSSYVVSTLGAAAKIARAAAAALQARSTSSLSALFGAKPSCQIKGVSTLSSSASLTAKPSCQINVSTAMSPSASLTAKPSCQIKGASTLSASATATKRPSCNIGCGAGLSSSATLDAESSCQVKGNATLNASSHMSMNLSSAVASQSYLGANAHLTKGLAAANETECSMSVHAVASRAAASELGSSLSLSASLSGAKSLFSVFADLDVSSKTNASASLDNEAHVEAVLCESGLAANVALMVAAMSSMESSCSVTADPRVTGEAGIKKREGSGHYVLNSGAFIFRQWKRFIKASDNRTPKPKEFESRRIDLRAPGLLRR